MHGAAEPDGGPGPERERAPDSGTRPERGPAPGGGTRPERGPGDRWRAPAATRSVHAVLAVPGSKSMTNRALVLAALADRPTLITGPLMARDTQLMADALRGLGCLISARDKQPASDEPPAGDEPPAAAWQVTPGQPDGSVAIDVGNAGTVMRFVPPVAALTNAEVEFRGDPRASERPAGPLLAGLRELGATISDGGRGAIPFTVLGGGGVPGGTVVLDASGSSQFVSGLLLAAPRFDKGAEIRHEGPRVPSLPHIAMTVQMLRDAGADVETASRGSNASQPGSSVMDVWRVHPGSLRPTAIAVEPDLSSAAPFLAAALVTGGSVTVRDWPARTAQPGGQVLAVLEAMGAATSRTSDGMRVTGTGRIRGITVDLRDIPELVPVVAALAALADSPSALTGIGHMRRHESDRLAALAGEINAVGGDVTERADGLEIRPRALRAADAIFDSHDDHRLVMAAAVLGLAAPGLTVRGAATVGKTFPAFTTLWSAMLEQSP
jgi:3-phosphoshikimate 1-carboxyvinyltransferase